jgi:predicted nucleic acid-binding protein
VSILVDTSVWSLALRRIARNLSAPEKAIVAELAALIDEGGAKIIGLVRQELLSGIKSSEQFEKLREILSGFPDELIDSEDYERAALFGNKCRSQGVSVSLPDLVICSVARSRGWSVFTTDSDFKRYGGILSIKLHARRK